MSTLQLSDTLLDDYVTLFTQLEQQDQTVLLDKLMESMRRDISISKNRDEDFYYLPEPANPKTLEELAGAWVDDRSAEEIIADLRQSRTPNRDRVKL